VHLFLVHAERASEREIIIKAPAAQPRSFNFIVSCSLVALLLGILIKQFIISPPPRRDESARAFAFIFHIMHFPPERVVDLIKFSQE